MNAARGLSVIALTILAGCASQSQPVGDAPSAAAPGAVTLDDAKVALINARHLWKDPDSIKDTRIGQPYSSGCWGHAQHWVQKVDACVCITTNAKNSYGGYAGSKAQVALLIGRGRAVLDMIDARSHDQCSNMTPWPEFDGQAGKQAQSTRSN